MKNLNEYLLESIGSNDFNKMDKVMGNKNKVTKFISDNESEVTDFSLGDDDAKDIASIMMLIHGYVNSAFENDGLDDIDDWFEEEAESWIQDQLDGESEDMIIPAISLYKKLFKETTHKDLDD